MVNGSTIKPLIGEDGRAPAPPDPAYQQVLHGVPAADFAADELLYLPPNLFSHRLYVFSLVEKIALTINIALWREQATLDYYNTGSIPDSFATLPKEWTVDQIKQFQDYFDALMAGNLARRRMVKFMPAEFTLRETRQPPLKDQYDEWLARVICYAFSVPASAFTTQVNRATSETLRAQAAQEGLVPLKAWVKMALDRAISVGFKQPDLEFAWVGDDAVDPLQQAQTIAILVGAGVKTVAEARVELGLGGPQGVAKYNHNHDERGRFTDADHAVDLGAGDQVADNSDHSATRTDAESGGREDVAIADGPMYEGAPEAPTAEPAKPVEAPPSVPDQALLTQLASSGVKVTMANVVAIGKTPSGQLVWLETGDQDSGLQHIITDHADEFAAIGVDKAQIPQLLIDTLAHGKIVGYQGAGIARPIYETSVNGIPYRIAITVGSNGYIVGANMRGRVK